MPGRTDGPGADPDARARADARGRAPGSQDEARRRLADLPASHPSSPRYRGRRPDGDRDEPAAGTPGPLRGERRGERREPGDRDEAAQDRRAPGPREAAGGAAAVAARLIRGGQPRMPEQDAKDRRADDALWARAAALHAAAQARRRARGHGGAVLPAGPARAVPALVHRQRRGRAVAERGGDRGSVVRRRRRREQAVSRVSPG
jgi:hypothetical protein